MYRYHHHHHGWIDMGVRLVVYMHTISIKTETDWDEKTKWLWQTLRREDEAAISSMNNVDGWWLYGQTEKAAFGTIWSAPLCSKCISVRTYYSSIVFHTHTQSHPNGETHKVTLYRLEWEEHIEWQEILGQNYIRPNETNILFQLHRRLYAISQADVFDYWHH